VGLEKLICSLALVLSCLGIRAQENWPTYVSPLYYGPNAFPVPDILKGTSDKFEIKIDASATFGHLAESVDKSETIGFSIKVPLWTERVNFSVWGQLWEWYQDTPEVRVARKSYDASSPLEGNQFGDIYFSVDANVLKEKVKVPGIVVRAAFKTASGECNGSKRFYDLPGYFFDASIFKSFALGGKHHLRLALSSGFLCWQVKQSRQNDAVMYGLSLGYGCDGIVDAFVDYGGYYGWRNDGDRPMTLKLQATFIPDRLVSPFFEYHHGFVDWPFDSVKIGAKFSFDILKK